MANQNTDFSDSELIAGIKGGSARAVRELYKLYFPGVRQLVLTNNGEQEDAEDLFQDAMMVLYKNTHKPEFNLTSSLYTYFYAICKNLWLKKLRKKDSLKGTIDTQLVSIVDDSVEEAIMEREQDKLFRRGFRLLGQDCQRVLQLFFEGASMEEIAEKMNFSSVAYAKKRKFKCKEQLIAKIKSDQHFNELVS